MSDGKITTAIFLATLYTSAALGSVVTTLQDTERSPSSIGNVNPGDYLTLEVNVQASEPITTLEFLLRASMAGVFSVDSLEFAEGWAEPNTLFSYEFTPGTALSTDLLMGSIRTDTNDPVSGSFTFATLLIYVSISPATPTGSYTLNIADPAAGSTNFQNVTDISVGTPYTIYVGCNEPEGDTSGGDAGSGDTGSDAGSDTGDDSGTDTGTGSDSGSDTSGDTGSNDAGSNETDDGSTGNIDNSGSDTGNEDDGEDLETPIPSPAPFSLCGAGISQMATFSLLGLLLLPLRRR